MRNIVKTLRKGKRWKEKLLYEHGNQWKKVDNRRLKNCVNLLTCRRISYERTIEPFKETYGETF